MRNPFAMQSSPSRGASSGPSDVMDDACDFCTLTKKQRLYGWAVCFVVGFLITILSTISLAALQFVSFAVLYTFGNVLSLASTGFLIGPMRQLKTMFAKVRVVATIIYLVALVGTLLVAILLKSVVLTIILCIIQFGALFWYCASYIPYGRAMIRKMVGGAASAV